MTTYRTQFTQYGLGHQAILQVREYVQRDRDLADGEPLKQLHGRGLCYASGRFLFNREQCSTIVAAAYAEGWHVKYDEYNYK